MEKKKIVKREIPIIEFSKIRGFVGTAIRWRSLGLEVEGEITRVLKKMSQCLEERKRERKGIRVREIGRAHV